MSGRGIGARVLLGLAATALALLTAELALRALDWSRSGTGDLDEALEASRRAELADARQEHSLRGLIQPSRWDNVVYELKPGLEGRFKGQPLAINSRGFRGAELEPVKPPGTFRIAGLGDSVMFGWGVGQGEDYLSELEQRLDRRTAQRIEVLNFAVPGYNTAMEVATFEHKVLPLDVDLVVLHLMVNDARLPRFMISRPPLFSFRHSALWSLMRASRRDPEAEPRLEPKLVEHWTAGSVEERFAHMIGTRGIRAALARLAHLTAERDTPVVIMLHGDGHRPEGIAQDASDAYGFLIVDPRPALLKHLKRRGLSVADFNATFWLSPADAHPNALAHRIYAKALARRIRQAGLIP